MALKRLRLPRLPRVPWLFWVLLLVGGAWIGWSRVRDGLARDPRFLATPARQTIRGPAWGGRDVSMPVVAALERLGPINLFDPDFEERVREAVASVPGVARVDGVRRLWPRRYAVELRLHRPAAVVLFDGLSLPVTARAVVLPERPYRLAARGLPRIVGVVRPPGRLGERWVSPPLVDGLATIRQLAPFVDELAPLQIAHVDVSGAADPLVGVRLRCLDGRTIWWGRPRVEVGENPVETKIAYLREAAAHLAAVRGHDLDVRFDSLCLRDSAEP